MATLRKSTSQRSGDSGLPDSSPPAVAPRSPRARRVPAASSSLLRAVWQLACRRPAPRLLVALYLSLRWRCRVWPSARIDWPGRLRIGPKARLYGCRIIARGRVELGAGAEVHDYAFLDTQDTAGEIVIGAGSAIGPFTIILGSGGVFIGKGCSIAGQSMIVASTHVVSDVSRPIRQQGYEAGPIRIEDDVWLGAQCTVLVGSVIGEGSVVGANSLVRGQVPPRVICAGTPVTVIRARDADPHPTAS